MCGSVIDKRKNKATPLFGGPSNRSMKTIENMKDFEKPELIVSDVEDDFAEKNTLLPRSVGARLIEYIDKDGEKQLRNFTFVI